MEYGDKMNYFAMGWFSEKQSKLYDKLKGVLAEFPELEWFFPRDLGINLSVKSPKKRELLINKVFALDTGMILLTSKTDGFVFAVIDDYDVGVVWEAGFTFGISLGKLPIVTYTDRNYGLNVMFRQSAVAHIKGEMELRLFLGEYIKNGANTPALLEVAKKYQEFSDEVF